MKFQTPAITDERVEMVARAEHMRLQANLGDAFPENHRMTPWENLSGADQEALRERARQWLRISLPLVTLALEVDGSVAVLLTRGQHADLVAVLESAVLATAEAVDDIEGEQAHYYADQDRADARAQHERARLIRDAVKAQAPGQ